MPQVPDGPKELNALLEAAYQSAMKQYGGDKGKASAVAWAAAEKAGWKKDKDGKWVKERKNEMTEQTVPLEALDAEPVVMQELAAPSQHMRLLAIAFKKSQMITQEDGSLLVKDVPMLAAGTWTDSAVQTALNYPERTLQKYAANWSDNSGWARHSGGVPRDATDKVAELLNPRFQDGAVVGDIKIHGYTQKSRDMIELVKRRLIGMVSVEHTGDEKYNTSTRQLEAESLNFSGFAFVNKGACKLCRINEEAPLVSADEPIAAPETVVQEDTMELKELETQVAELTKQLAAMQPVAKVEVAEPVVDNSRELAEQKEIEELRAQVKELMSRPAAPVVAAAPVAQVELKIPETIVFFDKRGRSVVGEA